MGATFFLPPTPEKCENGDVEYEGESNSKEVFFCDVCERSFLSKNARKKHKKKEHKVGVVGVASERVSKPCDKVEGAGKRKCEEVCEEDESCNAAHFDSCQECRSIFRTAILTVFDSF